jgi:hypothetical protein
MLLHYMLDCGCVSFIKVFITTTRLEVYRCWYCKQKTPILQYDILHTSVCLLDGKNNTITKVIHMVVRELEKCWIAGKKTVLKKDWIFSGQYSGVVIL